MNNLQEKLEPLQPLLEYGSVLFGEGRFFKVQASFGMVEAEQAVSCLVKPETGDIVLLSVDPSGTCFILSILKRTDTEKETGLVLEGQVNLHVKNGDLSLTSDRNMTFAAADELDCVGQKISLHAEEGEATITRMSFLGAFLDSQIKRVKYVADTVDTVYSRLTERLINAFRFVKEEEEIQTGSTRYLVEDTLTMHSKNAVHMSEEIVTINAEQVHLG